MNNRFPIDSDAPIEDPDRDRDRLGFGELARHLADVFLLNDLSRGLVVGIEGEWGSGKSSLANLVLKALENEQENHRLRIVRFSPWIVGNRDQLLGQLFAELDSVLYELLSIDRRDQVRTALRKYALGAALLASPLKIAGDMGIPGATSVGNALESVASAAAQFESPSLSKLNDELREKLGDHDGKIIVFIDDLDRLEPQETAEVLRLVRAVADFPKVAYLLAYDPAVLAKSLKVALGVKDGKAYIEKIIQASFPIPKPMDFDLRSWLAEEVRAVFDRTDLTSEANERLERALSCWCSEYISTPRDVVRTVNALKLHIAPLADPLDPADGLFIQIIRLQHPELHDWIQRYLMKKFGSDPEDAYLAWRDATQDSDGEQEAELARIIDRQGETQLQFLYELRQHLPQASIPDGAPLLAFGTEKRQQFAAEHRLNSASYFRLYFALSLPAGFLGDEEVSAFLDMCSQDRDAAVRHFRDRCAKDRPQGGNMAQALLSRILEREEDLVADRIPDLFAVLGDSMDDFARRLPERPGNPPYLYGDAIHVFRLIRHLGTETRMEMLKELFANAKSVTWLSGILGDAIHDHGFAGFTGEPKERRLLAEEQFECIREIFLQRLERTDSAHLKKMPYFQEIIHVWHWAGDGKQAMAWVRKQSSDDTDFIDLLNLMVNRSSTLGRSKTKDNYYLSRQTLKMFFGSVEAVEQRLDSMRYEHSLSEEVRTKARCLFSSIERETGS